MKTSVLGWLMGKPERWAHLRNIQLRQLRVLLLAVFLLFSVVGFYVDLMVGGTLPYAIVLANAVIGGINSVLWILVLARLPRIWLLAMIPLQVLYSLLGSTLTSWAISFTHAPRVAPKSGIHFAATSILIAVITSYMFFVSYIRTAGRELFRLNTELELAHSIQKTLVPPVTRETRCFEIFGISEPSEKVGGDLVDAVKLYDGDTVAYLADIAGHGLQAGILMGMLKTAARTALMDESCGDGGDTLSMLMERLNSVLPGVKEQHMYATFTALRLNLDGQSFYGMAASPPLLHWSAATRSILRIEEEQFPLGLLPVQGFKSAPLIMKPGDVVVIATDGILEVCAGTGAAKEIEPGAEFGIEALEKLMMTGAEMPLPRLAASILDTVRAYGRQVDDQTLLLVRRRL